MSLFSNKAKFNDAQTESLYSLPPLTILILVDQALFFEAVLLWSCVSLFQQVTTLTMSVVEAMFITVPGSHYYIGSVSHFCDYGLSFMFLFFPSLLIVR